MTAPFVKTPAEEALEAVLKSAQSVLPGDEGFASLRQAAIADLETKGLPNKRVEEWKYTDLKRAMPTELALAGVVKDSAIAARLADVKVLKNVDRIRLVTVNGAFRPEFSDLDQLPAGVVVKSSAEALRSGSFKIDDPEIANGDVMLSLNTALLQDGILVDIAQGTQLSKPIELRNIMLDGGLATTRNRVEVGKGVEVDLIESYSGDGAAYQVNTAIDYRIADDAKLHVMRVINEGDHAMHLGTTTAIVGGNARFEHFTMSLGGQFIRSQSFVRMDGEHSDADLFGASIVDGDRLSDITLKMDHAVPHCNSKEQYRTVLDDKAESVFQGQIVVRQYAQKTDAKMMSQALLLSEDAGFFNKPELEIYADDVVCGHGATCGELNEDLLFYLRARGIPQDMAKKMLVMAFLAEAIENVSNEQFVEALEAHVLHRLGIDM